MGLLDRTADVVNRRVTRLLDDLDDPDAEREYAVEQLMAEVDRVDDAIADLVTERERMEGRRETLEARIDRRAEQAREAVRHDRDDLARRALAAKREDTRRLEQVESRIVELREAAAELRPRRDELEERVERYRVEVTEEAARRTAADATATVDDALAGREGSAAGRATAAADEAEARAAAMDELRETGALGDDELDREIEQLGRDDAIERELEILRRHEGTDDDGEGDTGSGGDPPANGTGPD